MELGIFLTLGSVLAMSGVNSQPGQVISSSVVELCSEAASRGVDIDTKSVLEILSPDFASGHYPNNVTCPVVISTGLQAVVIHFQFSSFDVELKSDCGADMLCMGGVKFCGDWLTGTSVEFMVPWNSTFTVIFQSNSEITRPGFKAAIQARNATGEVISYPYAGVGSHPTQPFYTTKTLDSKYVKNYRDKCAALEASRSP
ncbi:hypothetical protein Btru_054053 [Bulinus truncatus]|nr:hypothetical protein Btru_054053 [Bulinus truncatus]